MCGLSWSLQFLPPRTYSKPFVFTAYHRQNQTMRSILCKGGKKKHPSWVGTISKELTHQALRKCPQCTVVIVAWLHFLHIRDALRWKLFCSPTFWCSVFLHFMVLSNLRSDGFSFKRHQVLNDADVRRWEGERERETEINKRYFSSLLLQQIHFSWWLLVSFVVL